MMTIPSIDVTLEPVGDGLATDAAWSGVLPPCSLPPPACAFASNPPSSPEPATVAAFQQSLSGLIQENANLHQEIRSLLVTLQAPSSAVAPVQVPVIDPSGEQIPVTESPLVGRRDAAPTIAALAADLPPPTIVAPAADLPPPTIVAPAADLPLPSVGAASRRPRVEITTSTLAPLAARIDDSRDESAAPLVGRRDAAPTIAAPAADLPAPTIAAPAADLRSPTIVAPAAAMPPTNLGAASRRPSVEVTTSTVAPLAARIDDSRNEPAAPLVGRRDAAPTIAAPEADLPAPTIVVPAADLPAAALAPAPSGAVASAAPAVVSAVDAVRAAFAPTPAFAAGAVSSAEVLVQAANAVADVLLVTPGLLRGQGEIRIQLNPDVLDGTEIKLAVTGRQLEVQFRPQTHDMSVLIERCRPQLEQHLAGRIHAFQIAVEVRPALAARREARKEEV